MHNGKIYWKCTHYYTHRCKARCHTINGLVVSQNGLHNHESDLSSIECRNVMSSMRSEALNTMNSTSQIISNCTRLLPHTISVALPPLQAIKRSIQRERSRHNQAPSNPNSLAEIVIPLEYSMSFDGSTFLQRDNLSENRILIFGTSDNLSLLSTHRNWYIDGTFKVCPLLFLQLFTVNVIINGSNIPILYALMARRNVDSYNYIFNFLSSVVGNNYPLTITSDFENASISSVSTLFPDTQLHGCYFHFNQALWRKIQSIPVILNLYNNDSDFKISLRMISALSFVPHDDVSYAYEQLINSNYFLTHHQILNEFKLYFEHTWIGSHLPGSQNRNPLFPIMLWNSYSTIRSSLPLTNNSLEGWHHGFHRLVNSNHPSLWTFINKLKEQHSLTQLELRQVQSGVQVRRQKKVYKARYERIKRLVDQYNRSDILSYLRNISYNISF